MTFLQVLIAAGVLWVFAILVVCAWFMARDALAQGQSAGADDEDWDGLCRIDQRRD